jgi:alkylation response protein AidB-like acyl-CoA dehydrogenase
MDFELSEEQRLIQQTAREFGEREIKPRVKELREEKEFPWDLYRRTGDLGFIGICWPTEYGGQGLKWLDAMIVLRELVRADPEIGITLGSGYFGSDMIVELGTDEQRSKWLPRLAKGEITSAGCFTEPAGGSDISRALDTKAEKRDGIWILNGEKQFITNGTTASVLVTLAQTDPNASPPYRGQTEFVVERTEAIEANKYEDKMGWYLSPTCSVRYNDVELSEEDILGGVKNLNKGFYIAMSFLNMTRTAIAWQALGTAEAALENAISYCQEREAFGRKIGGFQGLAFRIVDIATQVEMLQDICFRAAWLVDKAKTDRAYRDESVKVASMAKWYGSKVASEAWDLAIDAHAGYGYVESDVEKLYRFAKSLEIVEGTKEIQKNAIAGIILGREITKGF